MALNDIDEVGVGVSLIDGVAVIEGVTDELIDGDADGLLVIDGVALKDTEDVGDGEALKDREDVGDGVALSDTDDDGVGVFDRLGMGVMDIVLDGVALGEVEKVSDALFEEVAVGAEVADAEGDALLVGPYGIEAAYRSDFFGLGDFVNSFFNAFPSSRRSFALSARVRGNP